MPLVHQELADDYCATPTKHVRIQTFPVRRRAVRPNSATHQTASTAATPTAALMAPHPDTEPCSTDDTETDAPAAAPASAASSSPPADSATVAKHVSRRTFPTRRRGGAPADKKAERETAPPAQTQSQLRPEPTTAEPEPASTSNHDDKPFECPTPTKRVHVRTFPARRRVPRTKSDERQTAGTDSTDDDDTASVSSTTTTTSSASGTHFQRTARWKQNVVLYDDSAASASPAPSPARAAPASLFSRACEQPQRSAITLIDETRMPFLKAGDSQNETLIEFLSRDNRHLTWQKLLEAALSLRQLHEQEIVHGRLQCRNILITADVTQQARVRNFGAHYFRPSPHQLHQPFGKSHLAESSPASTVSSCWDEEELEAVRWRAPECLADEGWGHGGGGGGSDRASKEADVFSLGMCVLEAVTRAEPWGAVSDDVVPVLLQAGRLPSRPAGHFRDDQWELIERMCAKDPARRVPLGFVIKRLRVFAALERDARVALQREAPRVLYAAA